MTSVRYTAERLMEVGATWKHGTKSVAKRLEAQVDGDELLRFGSAWQEEVRQLRARFAELSAELRRVESLAAEAEKLRDWMTVDATCPCCMQSNECEDDCTFEADCPNDYVKMSDVREVLRGSRHGT